MRLSQRYEQLTTAQREKLADEAGIGAAYLYQVATRFRGKRPSIALMARLAAADKTLTLADMVEEFSEASAQKVEHPALKVTSEVGVKHAG